MDSNLLAGIYLLLLPEVGKIIENKLFKRISIGGINRSDVADFLIKQVENQTELKKYVGISEK